MRSKQRLTAEQEAQIKEKQRLLFFLWSMLSMSILIYGLIAYMSRVKVSLFDENLVFFFQLLMGGAFLLGSLNYRKLTRSLAAPRKGVSFKEGMVQLQNRLIISWALFESIVILGLVLFFQGLPLQEFYLYLGLSMLSMLAHPPRASFLRAVAEWTQAQEA
ncbi:MAG: hypothetical protein VYD19_07535 [Myxococcota bacterium]|nr:hypothetical protein [Myxococcota bacterium]